MADYAVYNQRVLKVTQGKNIGKVILNCITELLMEEPHTLKNVVC